MKGVGDSVGLDDPVFVGTVDKEGIGVFSARMKKGGEVGLEERYGMGLSKGDAVGLAMGDEVGLEKGDEVVGNLVWNKVGCLVGAVVKSVNRVGSWRRGERK